MRPITRLIAVAALLAACNGTPAVSTPSTAPGSTSDTTPAPASTGSTASASAAGIPEPTLTDPAAINAALFDPARIDIGVSSLLAQLGIGIDADDGTRLRTGSGSAFPDFHLSAREVLGLIDMGRADAAAITQGQAPWTLGDLAKGLVPVVRSLSEGDILARYVDAYRAAPGDLVPAILDGHPLLSQTSLTRVHLWLLLVDGVLGRHGPASAAGSVRTVAFRQTAAGPIAAVGLPIIPSPIPGLDARDFGLVIAHLPLLGYQVPITLSISPAQAHEGHGAMGPTVAIDARQGSVPTPLLSVVDGHPLLLPTRTGLDGVPISFESADEGIFDAHGALLGVLGAPILTDATGVAHLAYQVQLEEANGVGDQKTATATIDAVVDLRQMVLSQYAVDPSILALVWGTRRVPGVLQIDWHEAPAPTGNGAGHYVVDLTGPKTGAGSHVGTGDVYCAATTIDGRIYWSATGVYPTAPFGEVSNFDLQQNPSGFDTVLAVAGGMETGQWFARSNMAGETAHVAGNGAPGTNGHVSGDGTFTDSAGTVFKIHVSADCSETSY